MRVIQPSFEIQDDLDHTSIARRLEACGRICYKSEDRITEGSAVPFISKIASDGHNSVLEMAVLTVRVLCQKDALSELYQCQPKFLIIDETEDGILVTGSIRAFRELYPLAVQSRILLQILTLLAQKHPFLFLGLSPLPTPVVDDQTTVEIVPLAEVEQFSPERMLRHRFVGVKFVVNRAVTHELVRHRPCSYLQESQRYCRYSQDKFSNQVTFIKPLFFAEDSKEYSLWKSSMEEAEQVYLKLLETSTPQAARTVLPNSCKTEIITYCNLAEWKHIFFLRTSPAAEPSMREVMIPLQQEMKRRYPFL